MSSIFISSLIYRTNKVVKVTGGAFVPYDYLILCTGRQFQVPVPTGADISTLVTTSEVTMPKVSRYMGPLPSTVFTITTEKDCENALRYIRGEFLSGQGKSTNEYSSYPLEPSVGSLHNGNDNTEEIDI